MVAKVHGYCSFTDSHGMYCMSQSPTCNWSNKVHNVSSKCALCEFAPLTVSLNDVPVTPTLFPQGVFTLLTKRMSADLTVRRNLMQL